MLARETLTTLPPDLLDRRPERLVVVGFRCWMAGYEYRDVDCWEAAWNLYAGELDGESSRRALTGLQHWVRSVRIATTRTLKWFPHCCRHLCRDECMALSLISALQHGDLHTAKAAAHHLTGATSAESLGLVTSAGEAYAAALSAASQRLISVTPEVVGLIAANDAGGAHPKHKLQ